MGNTYNSVTGFVSNQRTADDIRDELIENEMSGLSLNSTESNISRPENSKNIIISYSDNNEELRIFPAELWSEILFRVEDKTLAKIVPRVSRLLYHFTSKNSDIWKQKCDVKYKESHECQTKTSNLSWKEFYMLGGTTVFFPLYGFTIGETSYSQLDTTIPDKDVKAGAQGETRYVTVRDVNFWFHTPSDLFTMMFIVRGIYVIPKEWEEKGLTWDKSFNEYKEWCRKAFGNYRVTELPTRVEYVGPGVIEAIAQGPTDVFCRFTLEFSHRLGDENLKGTLNTITVVSYKGLNQTKDEFEKRFNERKCEDLID